VTEASEELRAENARLRARVEDLENVEITLQALEEAGMVGRMSGPTTESELVELIVAAAEHIVGAQGSALFLVDEVAKELIVEVVRGGGGESLRKFRLPLDKGIVGFCATTGQPLVVDDATQDPRWAADIGDAVEYWPKTILSVPLIVQDRVIGVLQILDRIDGPFDATDIETASHFATLAAVAVEQHRLLRDLTERVGSTLADQTVEQRNETSRSLSYGEALSVANSLSRIARRGDAAGRLAERLVGALERYFETMRPAS